ncbi:TetR/AcrR family transcriptional regulator [Methylobacterium sp. WSM2598]|uniref:TetR/AcrR family transcriptional regulator n=1 Tax=Methylobacterium sp. WSM2598 TaxID=398261 RepID=UPI000475FB8A|nr:TetR/AcrR family transcriptional regulator [Methylobacterium sp. WSM2598]
MSTANTMPHGLTRARGRPREFDTDVALDRAISYFREHGYSGVSIADLSGALNLSAGSIYKAFHSKHELFCAALDRYLKLRGARLSEIAACSESGREKLRRVLDFYAESSHTSEGRGGCLVIVGTVELGSTDPVVAAKVADALRRNEERLTEMIRAGQSDGSIRKDLDAATTARALLAMVQGMRVLGKTGREREAMMAIVGVAMRLLD